MNFVKNNVSIFLILTLLISLSSCGGASSGNVPQADTSLPKITNIYPDNSLIAEVNTSTRISVTFNKAVMDNFTASNFLVYAYSGIQLNRTPIQNPKIAYDSNLMKVTYTSPNVLTENTKYHVVIRELTDPSGQVFLNEYSWDFKTISIPTIISVLPESFGYVENNPEIRVVFSEPIDFESLKSNIILDGKAITIDNTMLNVDTFELTFKGNFLKDSIHTLTINSDIKDLAGNTLGIATNREFTINPAPYIYLKVLQQSDVLAKPNITFILSRAATEKEILNVIASIKKQSTAIIPNPKDIPVTIKYNTEFSSITVSTTETLVIGETYTLNVVFERPNLPNIGSTNYNFTVSPNAWENDEIISQATNLGYLASAYSVTGIKTVVYTDRKLPYKLYQRFYNPMTNMWGSSTSPLGSIILANNITIPKAFTKTDKNNNTITGWMTVETIASGVYLYSLWVNRYSNDKWGTAKKITSYEGEFPISETTDGGIFNFDLSFNGDAFITWYVFTPDPLFPNSNVGTREIYFTKYTSGGSWTNPALIDTKINSVKLDAYDTPKIIMDGRGNGFIFWVSFENVNLPIPGGITTISKKLYPIYSNEIIQGVISAPVKLVPNSISNRYSIAGAKNRFFMLSWTEYDATEPVNSYELKSSFFNSNWSTPISHAVVSSPDKLFHELLLAENSNGIILWEHVILGANNSPSSRSHNIKYFDRSLFKTGWGILKNIANNTYVNVENKAISPSGNFVLTYQSASTFQFTTKDEYTLWYKPIGVGATTSDWQTLANIPNLAIKNETLVDKFYLSDSNVVSAFVRKYGTFLTPSGVNESKSTLYETKFK